MDDVFVGCLTHQEAFERYVRKCRDTEFLDLVNPHSHAVPAELANAISWQDNWRATWEKYVKDFIGHLTAGELHFFVVRPGTNEKVRIMPDDWRGDFWPSRPFMGERIVSASDSQLIKYSDRTPMISAKDLDVWLNKNKKAVGSTKRGPKPKINPTEFERKVHEILTEEGMPDPNIDPDFRQSNVEARMMDWHNNTILESRNRDLVAKFMKTFAAKYQSATGR